MKRQLLHQMAAGILGSLVAVQATSAQQQNGGGQFSSGQNQGGTTGGMGAGATSAPPGATSQAVGMNLPTLDFTQGTTAGAAGAGGTSGAGGPARGGTTARGTTSRRSTTAGRTGISSLGLSTGSLGGGMGGAGRGGMQSAQNNRQNERRAQYVTRMDFTPPPLAPGAAAEVQVTVQKSLTAVVPAGASVRMEGSTAVLSGTVPSVTERSLAERMALLEPGVRNVRNELLVENSPTAPQP